MPDAASALHRENTARDAGGNFAPCVVRREADAPVDEPPRGGIVRVARPEEERPSVEVDEVAPKARRRSDDSATIYYNYRHCEPVMGRWLSRDPIEEHGGVGLYSFVGKCNDCLGQFRAGTVGF